MYLKETGPLYGILTEDQVGRDPETRKLRMDPDVFHGMRQYLLGSEGPDRKLKEDRIKSSIASLANDPLAQKKTLRLEPAPLISYYVDKGKRVVYDFQTKEKETKEDREKAEYQKLLASSIHLGNAMRKISATTKTMSEGEREFGYHAGGSFQPCPTAYEQASLKLALPGQGKERASQRRNHTRARGKQSHYIKRAHVMFQ